MRILIQRVTSAEVRIGGRVKASIGRGLLLFVGVEADDGEEDIAWLAGKTARLRIFDDENGVMNLDVRQIGGRVLVVSQFTLHASTKRGNRPSYVRAAPEAVSRPLYERFVAAVARGAHRRVRRRNGGPALQRRARNHLDRFQKQRVNSKNTKSEI